jgi:hypothetical protein
VLGLTVTSIETRPSDGQVTSWVLSLDYDEQISPSERPKLHKLSPDLPYYDTKPPPGVTVAKVEIIQVNMLLTSTLSASACRPVPSDIVDYNPEGELDTDMLFSAMDDFDDAWSPLLFDHPDLDPNDIECNGQHTYFIAEPDVGITSNFGIQELELQSSEVFAPQQSCPYLTPPPSQGTLQQFQNEDAFGSATLEAQRRMSTGDVLQAIEAGLKYATLKSSTRKIKSATVVSSEGFKSLSSVVPALWVPDYHRSVAGRAVLIPTISHAIANVSSRASTNLGLGEKIRQLARQRSCKDNQTAQNNVRVRATEFQDALSVQIWQRVASDLSSAATARKLQPFSDIAEPNDHADAYENMEYMLDDPASDQESCTSCDESDFEDLHDTLGESGGDIASEMDSLDELGSMRSLRGGELEDPPVDAWDFESVLLSDSESDMLGDGLELGRGILCEAMAFSGGNFVDGHPRVTSQDGSSSTPTSMISEFEEIGTVGFDVECLTPDPWS